MIYFQSSMIFDQFYWYTKSNIQSHISVQDGRYPLVRWEVPRQITQNYTLSANEIPINGMEKSTTIELCWYDDHIEGKAGRYSR